MDNRKIKQQFLSSMQPLQLVLELLEKAELQLHRAQNAIICKDFESANTALLEAQAIFSNLAAMMKREDPASIQAAEFFFRLEDQCLWANLQKDSALLEEVFPIVHRLKIIYSYQLQNF